MRAREAKDFLVEQIKKQAALDEVSLSDVEIQMLYFSEAEESSEKMQKLSDRFDETCDMPTYETKIATLMQHAYKRLKSDDPQSKEMWDSSIRRLKRGDHYILVMWNEPGKLKPLLFISAAAILYYAVILTARWVTTTYAPPNPRVLLALFIAFIILCVVHPPIFLRSIDWLSDRILALFMKRDQKEED